MDYKHPQYLIDAASLQQQLNNPNLRIFDAAVFLTPAPAGGYQASSGQQSFEQEHIPGAGFIDLISAWSATTSGLNFTVPPTDELAQAIGNSGISAAHQVVLYSSGHLMWATRAWWLLHYAGHNNIAVLNGNLASWKAAGFPLASGDSSYPATTFTATPKPGVFADTAEVAAGMHGKVCTINALSKSLYEGTGDFYYQRRGHIPGSRLLSYGALLDNEYFLPAEQLQQQLGELGMRDGQRLITYCGGGIAATVDAFAAKLLGHDNTGVYDGSMSEWVQDEARPLTLGANP